MSQFASYDEKAVNEALNPGLRVPNNAKAGKPFETRDGKTFVEFKWEEQAYIQKTHAEVAEDAEENHGHEKARVHFLITDDEGNTNKRRAVTAFMDLYPKLQDLKWEAAKVKDADAEAEGIEVEWKDRMTTKVSSMNTAWRLLGGIIKAAELNGAVFKGFSEGFGEEFAMNAFGGTRVTVGLASQKDVDTGEVRRERVTHVKKAEL